MLARFWPRSPMTSEAPFSGANSKYQRPGGSAALKLQLSERYIEAIKGLETARIILPANILEYRAWLGNLELDSLVDKPVKDKD